MGIRTGKRVENIAIYEALILLVFVCVSPIFWMCLISVKDTSESISGWNSLWVNSPTLNNYRRFSSMISIWKNASNSVFTTILGTVTSLFFRSLAGFALAKYEFLGRNVLSYFVIATILVPPEVEAVPLFVIMKELNLINSLWSLIIPRITAAVDTSYVHRYITDTPDELIEAARIDGRNDLEIFTNIIIPVTKPVLTS